MRHETDSQISEEIRRKLALFDGALPLEAAKTIPSLWYRDSDIFALEKERVFGRRWLAVCRVDQLAEVGSYVQTRLAGERILVVRSPSGELKAFYDVCRHKAASVVSAPCGKESRFRCRYHGWTYDLNGQLIGTPDFKGVENFDRTRMGLRPVAVEVWGPLVFAHLGEPAMPLSEYLAPLIAREAEMGLSDVRFHSSRVYDLDCNWKVFIDNYLDGGYHINTVHPGLANFIDYSGYRVINEGFTSLQYSPMANDDSNVERVRPGKAAYYWWIHPNLMINAYEGVMDTNLVVPTGVNSCRVIFDYYFSPDKAAIAEKSIEMAHQVQLEDEGVCREVQEGLSSRSYDTGRFSVKRESGGYFFHRLLSRELCDS